MKNKNYFLILTVVSALSILLGCKSTKQNDEPARIAFYGSESAETYTKIIDSSFIGVLTGNYFGPGDTLYPEGFVQASQYPRFWYGTFWTRDGGTFLRELVHYGYFHHAKKIAACLINLVDKNKDGFYAFPMFFKPKEKNSGSELDGTSAIIIAMVDLWKALDEKDSMKAVVYNFLHQESSPLRFIHHQLGNLPLLPGEGEFGPGCGIPGAADNVVQNYLSALALLAGKEMETIANDKTSALIYEKDAQIIQANMLKYLVGDDSAWIWCIDPETLKADPKIINDTINEGFGGIQGVSCMYSDVLGLDPMNSGWKGIKQNLKTFDKLYSYPLRKEQFEKYGIWTQFNKLRKGYLMSPSYGHGYALQTMFLYDKLSMADSAVAGFSKATVNPCPTLILHRTSPYHIYERYYSPDAVGKILIDEGCGALNLVNVTEHLKVARLIIGIDDHDLNELKLFPRVPPTWTGFIATNMPVLTSKGVIKVDITYKKENGKIYYTFKSIDEKKIGKVSVRLPEDNNWKWIDYSNVSEFKIIL
jgi:hypothetical protein